MKMKSLKTQFIGAIAMVLVAAIAMGSSTYAWFAMNTQVKATGMQVQAKSEGGIVISNESGTNWNDSATASHNSVAYLIPTSTNNVESWYHNTSTDVNSAAAGQATGTYATVSSDGNWKNVDGVQFIDLDEDGALDANENCYFLLNKFYIKSSSDAINPATLKINQVKASGIGTSALLDASLRVAIKIGGNVYIYAPVTGATCSYQVAGATATTAVDSSNNAKVNTAVSGVTSIPANSATTANAVEAQVFIYFEGEDPECKSYNITGTLDTLQIEVVFGTTDLT